MTPDLVVYPDGQLIFSRYSRGTTYLWETHLSNAELCALLSQVEATGFFDFPHSAYEPPVGADMSTVFLAVRAWRATAVSAYGLIELSSPSSPEDTDPPEDSTLVDTYHLLQEYEPAGAQPYQPDRVAIRVEPLENPVDAPLWPLESPALEELAAQTPEAWGDLVVEGETATAVYDLFEMKIDDPLPFQEGDTFYEIWMRPLLPFESPHGPGTYPYKFRLLPGLAPEGPMPELTCDFSVSSEAAFHQAFQPGRNYFQPKWAGLEHFQALVASSNATASLNTRLAHMCRWLGGSSGRRYSTRPERLAAIWLWYNGSVIVSGKRYRKRQELDDTSNAPVARLGRSWTCAQGTIRQLPGQAILNLSRKKGA
jgi:hypothetical protein